MSLPTQWMLWTLEGQCKQKKGKSHTYLEANLCRRANHVFGFTTPLDAP